MATVSHQISKQRPRLGMGINLITQRQICSSSYEYIVNVLITLSRPHAIFISIKQQLYI
jgi:hypothetical protein